MSNRNILMSAVAVAALSPAVGEQTQGDTSARVTEPPTPGNGIRSADALKGSIDRTLTATQSTELGRVGRNLLSQWLYGANGITEIKDPAERAKALQDRIDTFCQTLSDAGAAIAETTNVDPSIHAVYAGRSVNGPRAVAAMLGEDKALLRLMKR